jgi:hypothetical protein
VARLMLSRPPRTARAGPSAAAGPADQPGVAASQP